MRDDAFDDLPCPFDYRAELNEAREALNKKVRECVSRDWKVGYRELAKRFNMSPGALHAIARHQKLKRKPGRRPRRPRSIDDPTVQLPSDAKRPPDLP